MVHEETVKDLKQCELEQEKAKKKVEVLTQELWSVQNECGVRVREVESRLCEQGQRLEVYEKLEKELDEVVMQAAEGECLYHRSSLVHRLPQFSPVGRKITRDYHRRDKT